MSDAQAPDGPADAAGVWALLSERLVFAADGAIEWTGRPFARRWAVRRLGRAGVAALLEEHVGPRAACYLLRAGQAEPAATTSADGARALCEDPPPGGARPHRWLVDARGRWVAELSAEGTFTFEFVSPRDRAMLERLRAIERQWSAGPTLRPE